MSDWLGALTKLERDGQPAVLITVLTARGSTPREAGCKMVVTGDAQFGTIGGGNLEYRCTLDARQLLAEPSDRPVVRDFPLGPALGQCCGGHVSILFEPIRPATAHVALFGAGHVGRALVQLLGELPVRVAWIDPRPEVFPAERPANTTCHAAMDITALPAGSHVLIMTHDHRIDFEIVSAALSRGDFASVGLIGSATKRARFVSRLAKIGVDSTHLVCPIGLPGIASKQPAAIAIGVAAQLLTTCATSPVNAATPVALACMDCARHPEGACV